MRIANSVCVVVNGSTGVEVAVTRLLHQLGAKIAIWDENDEAAYKIIEELRYNVIYIKCDITQPNDV